jgi:S-DNA-T family DNA segregation ATPase FtsK/SpoIIIE
MYERALEIVAESRNASISYLQRRLKVGYNRAARMVEQMEADGVVGPQEGTKPRDVYVRPVGALE